MAGAFKSQAEAARRIGITAQQLNKYIAAAKEPRTPVLERMAKAGLDVSWYLTGEKRQQRSQRRSTAVAAAAVGEPSDLNYLLDLEVIPLGQLVDEAQQLARAQLRVLERLSREVS